jgi:hypothetical protein
LIWGLANNNYSLYVLQFLTIGGNLHLCYIFRFYVKEMRKNKSKVCFVESSFGQKVLSTFPVAQYRIASPYQNGTIVV